MSTGSWVPELCRETDELLAFECIYKCRYCRCRLTEVLAGCVDHGAYDFRISRVEIAEECVGVLGA